MEKMLTYCIRCGRPLHSSVTYFSMDDPDHEEPLCRKCYKRYECKKVAPEKQNDKKRMESEV